MSITREVSRTPGVHAAAFIVAILAPFALYFDTARSIVSIWNSSETFAHGYIILPIVLYMIWQRRESLRNITLTPYWPGLVLLVLCGFAWLLAELGEVQVVRQYALVAMLPIICITVLGLRLATAIAFPLFFLLLAVPFGDIFIEPLIKFTADFTVAALQVTGMPVWREGANFVIPSGNWSVVTACSGVRYLIASFTLGCLYAYLTYKSPIRRFLFIVLSMLVPIVANGIRAYIIVMIGHLSGMKLAVGVDHLIYGWLFFGLVMIMMFWLGSFWREDIEPALQNGRGEPSDSATGAQTESRFEQPWLIVAALIVIASLAIWPWYANHVRQMETAQAAALSSFTSDWPQGEPFTDWQPHFLPANAELRRFYRSGEHNVGINILYYRNQNPRSMLISSTNQIVAEDDQHWKRLNSSMHTETVSGQDMQLRETVIEGSSGRFLVWAWYWVGGRMTANDYYGKLLQAKDKLVMSGDDSAAIMLFTPYYDNHEQARAALRQFLSSNNQPLLSMLNKNKNHRTEGH